MTFHWFPICSVCTLQFCHLYAKGQYISKANYKVLDSKKQTKHTQDSILSEFCLFFVKVKDAIVCFGYLLTFTKSTKKVNFTVVSLQCTYFDSHRSKLVYPAGTLCEPSHPIWVELSWALRDKWCTAHTIGSFYKEQKFWIPFKIQVSISWLTMI